MLAELNSETSLCIGFAVGTFVLYMHMLLMNLGVQKTSKEFYRQMAATSRLLIRDIQRFEACRDRITSTLENANQSMENPR